MVSLLNVTFFKEYEALKALTHVLSIDVSEIVGEAATAPVVIGGGDVDKEPVDISVLGKRVCLLDGAPWGWALLTWAMVHTVFAVVPKPRHQPLLFLVQDRCLSVKERPLPERAAKVMAFLQGDA